MEFKEWKGFKCGEWQEEINVRDFIQKNYTPYEGDSSFLEGTTTKTSKLWDKVLKLYEKEKNSQGGVLDIDTKTNNPQGEATLEGATYGIYNTSDERVGTIFTGVDGKVQSDYLPSLGRFYVLEETPSNGYQLDTLKYYFDITRDNLFPEINVYEKVIDLDFSLTKVFIAKCILYASEYIIKNSFFSPVIATNPQIAIPTNIFVSIIRASYKLLFSISLIFGNLIVLKNNISGGIKA